MDVRITHCSAALLILATLIAPNAWGQTEILELSTPAGDEQPGHGDINQTADNDVFPEHIPVGPSTLAPSALAPGTLAPTTIGPTILAAPAVPVFQSEPTFQPEPVSPIAPDVTIISEPVECLPEAPINLPVGFGDWLGYNSTDSDTTWLTGAGDRLGIFSLESFPSLDLNEDSAVTLGTGFHFLNGPVTTDLPPRLFDLQIAYQARKAYEHGVVFDYRLGVGAFTDFEGSVRKGIRFPGHAVGYYEWHPWLVSVLGIEMLDRDDVSVLPVAGLVWRVRDNLLLEAVFPRPRLSVKLNQDHAAYLSGELGGGTWAIERANFTNDNVTYRDFRVLLGIHEFEDDNQAFEIGWSFGRKLDYRSSIGNYRPDDTLILRFRAHY